MPDDPVVKSGRREALFTLGLWIVASIYTVGYCSTYGYGRAADSLSYVLWFPDWVFWGIVVPWLVCALVSSWYALRVMEDDPLTGAGDAPPEQLPAEGDDRAEVRRA